MAERLYKKFLWASLAAILAFSPIARGAVRIWSVTPVLLVETLLIFAWLLRANNHAGYPFKKTGLDAPILAFCLLALASSVFSVYKHDSLYALLGLFGYVGVYYVVVNEFDLRMRNGLIKLAIFIGTAISLYGLLQYSGFLGHPWWAPQKFLAATYVNHNNFSGYLELAIPLTIGMAVRGILKEKGSKGSVLGYEILMIASLVIMTAAFVLAQSRGAWISMGISFLLMGLIFIRKGIVNLKNIFLFGMILLLILCLAYFGKELIFSRLGQISGQDGGDISMRTRLLIWKGSADMILHNPLIGSGIGTFVWAFTPFRPQGLNVQANFAHNDYLQMAAEMGMLAPLIFLWMALIVLISIMKKGHADPVKISCAIGILSLSLHGLVDFNFHIPANMLLFTVCAAIAMSVSRGDDKEKRDA